MRKIGEEALVKSTDDVIAMSKDLDTSTVRGTPQSEVVRQEPGVEAPCSPQALSPQVEAPEALPVEAPEIAEKEPSE